jgi:predicted amidohydrolase
VKLALCQTNPIIGDIAGNTAKIREHCRNAAAAGAALAIFPEMSITGYPPMDLIENPAFIEANLDSLYALAEELACPAVIGYIARESDGSLFNAAALIAEGEVQAIRHKCFCRPMMSLMRAVISPRDGDLAGTLCREIHRHHHLRGYLEQRCD